MPLVIWEQLLLKGGGLLAVPFFRGLPASEVPGMLQLYLEEAELKMRRALGAEYETALSGGRPTLDDRDASVTRWDELFNAERALAQNQAFLALAALSAGLATRVSEGGVQRDYDPKASSNYLKLAGEQWSAAVAYVPALAATEIEQPAESGAPTPIITPVL
jgi:hypothetical protein